MADLAALPTRSQIDDLQRAMATLPQTTLDTRHYFAGGVYLRELHIPAGVTLVGKVHKHQHCFILMTGRMTLTGEGFRQEIEAPYVVVSEPNTKRAGYAHVDSVCLTVHRTDATELEQIEWELVEQDDTALFDCRNELKVKELA